MIPLVHRTPPDAPRPKRPRPKQIGTEWRALVEIAHLSSKVPFLVRLPTGSGQRVLLLPGWRAPEWVMEPLRLFLRAKGFDAEHWGLGKNEGDPEGDSHRMAAKLRQTLEPGEKVALVGWSLGGVIARETARLVPELVSLVVTYGTPARGGPTYTRGADRWGQEACEDFDRRTFEADQVDPIQVPIAAIFSRRDFIVSWPACIDRYSLNVTHYEVDSTHIGMGYDPHVWSVIAHTLADGSQMPMGQAKDQRIVQQ